MEQITTQRVSGNVALSSSSRKSGAGVIRRENVIGSATGNHDCIGTRGDEIKGAKITSAAKQISPLWFRPKTMKRDWRHGEF